MSAVLAVDGGQSGIRLAHSASDTVVEVAGVSRSDDTVAAVGAAISRAWTQSGFPPVDRAVLGLTTAPIDAGDANRLCKLVSASTGATEVWLADDTVTAHHGALSGAAGVCLVVGTGVACLAVPEDGPARTFDGHGYLLGDEGGAFWIGQQALRLALRDHDLERVSALLDLARRRFGSIDGVEIRLHEAKTPVNDIAQFAQDVLTASHHDNQAAGIVSAAAELLFRTVTDAVTTIPLGGGPGDAVAVALGGRLVDDGSPLRRELEKLLATHGRVRALSALGTPLEGALTLGADNTPGRYRALVHVWKKEGVA